MFRPFRFVLPVVVCAGALGFSGCVGTMYDSTYSYKRNHFKPPQEKREAAESYLSALDKPAGASTEAAVPGGLPPAEAAIPGLPPAGAPDAGAAPPAAPAAPAAPPAEPPKQ